MEKKCRHKEIMVCDEVVKCCSCGKVWLQHKGNVFRDLSFRAGGFVGGGYLESNGKN